MEVLLNLRTVLREVSKDEDIEVLPAVGGALEDLERPDFEEREDQSLNEDEQTFETFERASSGTKPPLYQHVPHTRRPESHLFRYFLDGSLVPIFWALS